ncbi:MAG: nucleotidyltransferase domain-containing protein [Candidatus Omnitrophota bacterium]|nr:nucleotidyltransferase domain-containing protein [Candidatus Omnitrophota bacterium]
MSKEQLKNLLEELKKGLSGLYGRKLKGLYLFGSYARGTQEPESDLDVLVILDSYQDYGAEIRRTGKLISDLSLENDLSISVVFVRESDWKEGDNPFLRNVRQEAIAA